MSAEPAVEIKSTLEETLGSHEPFKRVDEFLEELKRLRNSVSWLPQKAAHAGLPGIGHRCDGIDQEMATIIEMVSDRRAAIVTRVVEAHVREKVL